MSEEKIEARLLNVTEVSPRAEVTTQMTRTNPADGDDWEGIDDTIAFPDTKSYMKANNTEKMRYETVTFDENDIAFREVERGVLEDFLIGYFCGEEVDPEENIPYLQNLVGVDKPIYGVLNYQAAIETGLSTYSWYNWLYDRGMILQLAYEPKNPAKGNTVQPEWSTRTYLPGRVRNISTIARTSNVATVVTTAAHGLVTGEYIVTRAQDITFNETDDGNPVTVINPTTFTYVNSGSDIGTKADYGIMHRIHYTKDISTVARSSNVATVVTTASHALITGDLVDIEAVDTSFDEQNISITKISATSFTYANTGGDIGTKADAGETNQAGYHDDDFIRWAASIVSFCETDNDIIYIRPMSEMNGDWTTWGKDANGNQAGDYISAWQHLYTLFERDGAGAYLKWIWCPTADLSAVDADDTWNGYYPGDAYVDIIGINGYNWGDVSWSYWRDFTDVFQYSYTEFAGNTTKDLIIAEMGCNSTGGQKHLWIEDAAYQMRNTFTRFIGAFWFNMLEPSDPTIDLSFNQTQLTIDSYKDNTFFKRECTWSGTSDCIHRVKHAVGSEILGMGENPVTTEPIKEKVGVISLDGDILQNVPIKGDLWMYFENMSYVEGNTWVELDLPKPTLSQDLYDGDIMNQNMGNVFGNPIQEGYLKITGLSNATPPIINQAAYTPSVNTLDEVSKDMGTIEKGNVIFGVTGKNRIEISGDGSEGTFGIYNASGQKVGALGNENEGTYQTWKEGQYAGSIYPVGSTGSAYEQQTHSTKSDYQDLGTTGCRHIAQQFTASSSYNLAAVRLRIGKHNSRPGETVYVRLFEDDGSNFPGTHLSTAAIFVNSSYPVYFDVNFPNISLTSGNKYWVSVVTTAIYSSYPMRLYGANTDAYPSHYCKGYSGGWYVMANTDAYMQFYKSTTSLSIGVDADFDLNGQLLRGVKKKIIIPLYNGGGKSVLTGVAADWMNKQFGDTVDHLLSGPYYWYANGDWYGQGEAWYFNCWFKSNTGNSVYVYLWDDVGGVKLATLSTSSTSWTGYTSSLLSMPANSGGLAIGVKTASAADTVQVQSAYLEVYIGDI